MMSLCFLLLIVTQILIEPFPVSSSGHVQLVLLWAEKLGFATPILPEWIEYLLHLPTLAAIAWVFRRTWIPVFVTIGRIFYTQSCRQSQRRWLLLMARLMGYILCAIALSIFPYLMCKYVLRGACGFDGQGATLVAGFIINGLLLFSLKFVPPRRIYPSLALTGACILGTTQGIAKISSLSRLASTVVIAQWMGISPRRSFDLSFALFVPLIAVATAATMPAIPLSDPFMGSLLHPFTLGIMAITTALSALGLTFSYYLARTGRFWLFGVYMIIPTILSLLLTIF